MKQPRTHRTVGLILTGLVLVVLIAFRAIPKERQPFDYIQWKATELDHNRDRIIAFVRSTTEQPHYEGCLRGPVGTLWADAGNELDRVSLLVELLRAAGETARYATDGASWWAELSDASTWRPIPLSVTSTPQKATWTGIQLPESMFHQLECRVVINDREAAAKSYRVSELADHPLCLTFSPEQWQLCPERLTAQQLNGHWDATLRSSMTLKFTHVSPNGTRSHFRREIFTDKHTSSHYAHLNDPRNSHVIAVTAGHVPRWVFDRELELTRQSDASRDLAANYMLALSHMVTSDERLQQCVAHFETDACLTEPRVIIGSTYYQTTDKAPTGRALDLRRNRIHIDNSDHTRRLEFAATRSILEAQLEHQILQRATDAPVTSSLAVLQQHIAPRSIGSLQRIQSYRSSLRWLLEHGAAGQQVAISGQPGGGDVTHTVTFTRQQDATLAIDSLQPAIRQAASRRLRQSFEFPVLSQSRVSAADRQEAAVELELLFGSAETAISSSRPQIRVQESSPNLLAINARIFSMSPDDPAAVRYEFQIRSASADGAIEYDSVDYWDEVDGAVIEEPRSTVFRIPARTVNDGKVISGWYSQARYQSEQNFLCFSRTMYRDLVEKGHTTVRYGLCRSITALSEPLTLHCCRRGTIPLNVNSRVQQVPVMWVAGGFDHPERQSWDDVEPLYDDSVASHTPMIMNKFVILDDPQFPLILRENVRLQTRIDGCVTVAGGDAGIADATVSVEGSEYSGNTGPDGRFRLPVIRQPHAEFTVTTTCDGFQDVVQKVDFRDPETIPLRIEMTPDVRPADFIVVTADNRKAALSDINNPRVASLVANALDDDPALTAIIPRSDVAYGAEMRRAWILIDESGQMTFASDDGLHSAAGLPLRVNRNALGFGSGYITSWYTYSAGRLDALVLKHGTVTDLGDPHAAAFALNFLDQIGKALTLEYRLGFRTGLKTVRSILHDAPRDSH